MLSYISSFQINGHSCHQPAHMHAHGTSCPSCHTLLKEVAGPLEAAPSDSPADPDDPEYDPSKEDEGGKLCSSYMHTEAKLHLKRDQGWFNLVQYQWKAFCIQFGQANGIRSLSSFGGAIMGEGMRTLARMLTRKAFRTVLGL